MKKSEIEQRKKELAAEINAAETEERLNELKAEVDALNSEVPEVEKDETEERNLFRNLDTEKRNFKKIGGSEEMSKKEERKKFDRFSPEYRSAWAKTMMGLELNEIEKRAIGDAIGTTSNEFVASSAEIEGVNNLGLFIPGSIETSLLERAENESPIFRDIRKLHVNGNIELPYLFAADDASWVSEKVETPNEGQEYKELKLTGYELAKDVVITWKSDAMTVDGFIDFIVDEIYEKMYKAKVLAVIYGNGQGKPTGATNGVKAVTANTAIETIRVVLKSMSKDAKKGAKIYVSSTIAEEMTFYKDNNGNYPYLISGLKGTEKGKIEEDPYLNDGDILVGNMRNYIFNENEPIALSKEKATKGRKVTYGGYQIVDGMGRPGYFGYGKMIEKEEVPTV